MRFAYLDGSLALRSHVSNVAVDAEWLVEQSKHHEIVTVVDDHGPGAALLTDAGIEVMVSAKRAFADAGVGRISAEHALVNRLADLHSAAPFDMMVFGSAVTTDPSWYAPALASVPQVVTLGGGPIGSLRLIADDPGLTMRHGREAWASVSRLASADAVLGRADAAAFGLGAAASIVPRLDPGGDVDLSVEPPPAPDQIVVIALTEDRAGLGSLIPRLVQRVEIGRSTTIVVVVPNVMVGSESTASLVVAGCPERLQTSTIVVPPGPDGSAAAFLGTADLVVAAGQADLAVNAVVDATGGGVPVVLLGGTPPTPGLELVPPKRRRQTSGERVLVPFDGAPGDVCRTIEASREAEYAVLHTGAGASEAVKLAGASALGGYDLVVLGGSHPITGHPSGSTMVPDVLAVHRDAMASVLRRLPHTPTLWDLIVSSLSLSLADRVRLGVLPAPAGLAGRPLPNAEGAAPPSWIGGVPLMPRLNLAALEGSRIRSEPAEGAGVRDWVKTHRWTDRARLALPWKWGVLGRAMRDRW